MFEDCIDNNTAPPQRDLISLNQSSTFECQLDDNKVDPPLENQKILLATCYGVVPSFNISAAPYKLQEHTFPLQLRSSNRR